MRSATFVTYTKRSGATKVDARERAGAAVRGGRSAPSVRLGQAARLVGVPVGVGVPRRAIRSAPSVRLAQAAGAGLPGGRPLLCRRENSPRLRGMIQCPPQCAEAAWHIGRLRFALDRDSLGFLGLRDLLVVGHRLFQLVG